MEDLERVNVENCFESFCVKGSQNVGCEFKSRTFSVQETRVGLCAVGQNVVKRKINNSRDSIMRV